MPVNHLRFTFTGSHTCAVYLSWAMGLTWIKHFTNAIFISILLKLCLFTPRKNWFIRLASSCWCLQQIQALAHSCCAAVWCQSTFVLGGKERRLSLPVPLDHYFTSAHFHGSVLSHIQKEIFPQLIQSRRSWSKFVKYFVILVGKTLQKSWCTAQMVFKVK